MSDLLPEVHLTTLAKPVVYVVEDDEALRFCLTTALARAEIDIEAFSSPTKFLAAYQPQRPGCLVLDLILPEMSGLDLSQELRNRDCWRPFILVTGRATIPVTVEAMRQGAFDVLEKPFERHRLIASVKGAMHRDQFERHCREVRANVASRVGLLTGREREVMELVVDGRLTKQIAKALGISTKTVEVHRSNITRKMGVDSVPQLVKLMFGHKIDTNLGAGAATHVSGALNQGSMAPPPAGPPTLESSAGESFSIPSPQ